MPNSHVTAQVAANLLVVAVGYALKRWGILPREQRSVLNRLILYVTMPAVNVSVWAGAEPLEWRWLLLPILFLAAVSGIWLGGLLPARWLRLARAEMGTFVVALCGVMGSLAYPFVEVAWGDEGMRAVALVDMGNALAIFGMAYALSLHWGAGGRPSMRQVINKVAAFFPIYAFFAGLLLNITRIRLGSVAEELFGVLARANSPLMLLALGAYLELDVSWREARVLGVHLVYKYGLGIGVALLMMAIWPLVGPVSGPARAVAFVFPLLPAPLSTLIYAAEQGLNARLAAMLISLSMIVSLAIIVVVTLGFRGVF